MAEEKLTGIQKTAILLLALGDDFTSDVFKHLDKKEITQIGQAMAEMYTVSRENAEAVLTEFNQGVILGKEMLMAGPEQVKRILRNTLDEETAKYVLDALKLDEGEVPFKELEDVNPKILARILQNEHPQTLALIVGHLPSEVAADFLSFLPAGVRPEVLMRLAKLEAIPEEMLTTVDEVLQSQLVGMGGREGHKAGGTQAVAEILNAIDRATEEEILADIEEESAQLAEEIKALMFVFDDIIDVDDRAIREVLKEIQNDDLTLALKAANDDLKNKFFGNLSERAGNMIKEDLEIMGPVKLSDVEAAQQKIVRVIRRLEAEGKIVLGSKGGGDTLV